MSQPVRGAEGHAPAEENVVYARDILSHWLAACARRDERAFENLYRYTAPKLYAFAIRILRHEGLAKECLQDAYVSIWNHAADYRPALAAPLTWMVSILRHRALDLLRQRRHEVVLDGPDDLESLADTRMIQEDDLQDLDTRALYHCLAQLRDEQRHCLELAYFESLSHAELAEHLHVPLGTVKTWIRRGLDQLRKCLK